MVDVSSFSGRASDLFGKLAYGSIVVVGTLILMGVILGVALYVRHLRKFNIRTRIKSKRSSGADGKPVYKVIWDWGGIIRNKKDKTSFFRLRGEKIDMPSPPSDVIQMGVGGRNEIEILQESDEEYYYLKPSQIDKTVILREGKEIPIAQAKMKIVEGDIGYWNVQRKKINKSVFDVESIFMKLLPYAIPALMIIGVVFYTYIWLDKAPAIISAAREVAAELNQAAQALREITIAQTAVS